jgi:hypothetical protein
MFLKPKISIFKVGKAGKVGKVGNLIVCILKTVIKINND